MAFPIRYKIVGLLTLGSTINYLDRVNISVAAPVMMVALGWDEARFGLLFSAFLFGYALLQFPGGVLADRWNPRWVLAIACIGFSVLTALTPLGAMAFGLMLLLRFGVGLFESVIFPVYAAVNSRWVPRHEYGRAQAISISGSHLGQVISYPLITWLVLSYSWQTTFYFNALVGAVWVIVWLKYSTNTPAEHPKVSEKELHEIESNLAPSQKTETSAWAVIKIPQVLLLSLAYMCTTYGLWVMILWLPTYLVNERGFTMEQMGWLGMIPALAGFIGMISGGTLSDLLVRRGFSTRFARARTPGLCLMLLGAPAVVAAALMPSAIVSVVCLAIFMYVANLSIGAAWAIPLEINPRLVASISGVMNGAGIFSGIFGPMTAGFLVTYTGSWTLPFLTIGVLSLISGAVYFFLVDPKPMEIDASLVPNTA